VQLEIVVMKQCPSPMDDHLRLSNESIPGPSHKLSASQVILVALHCEDVGGSFSQIISGAELQSLGDRYRARNQGNIPKFRRKVTKIPYALGYNTNYKPYKPRGDICLCIFFPKIFESLFC